ncbi:glutathione-specific gamma-glutamylcyclotransferase 2 [Lates japonicus]|uniref:Glutathione-specific gamma-glutamylcyclotransferase 2 n=1 Tax=Lates japonicus TaxID=270547 RepID=A0AAD3ND92_LATJO|nr:glutathione-specific gamma-glutamylcyclotransferase 2 [Lates japonicus]
MRFGRRCLQAADGRGQEVKSYLDYREKGGLSGHHGDLSPRPPLPSQPNLLPPALRTIRTTSGPAPSGGDSQPDHQLYRSKRAEITNIFHFADAEDNSALRIRMPTLFSLETLVRERLQRGGCFLYSNQDRCPAGGFTMKANGGVRFQSRGS